MHESMQHHAHRVHARSYVWWRARDDGVEVFGYIDASVSPWLPPVEQPFHIDAVDLSP